MTDPCPVVQAQEPEGDQEIGDRGQAVGYNMQPEQLGCPQTEGMRHEATVEEPYKKFHHPPLSCGAWRILAPNVAKSS